MVYRGFKNEKDSTHPVLPHEENHPLLSGNDFYAGEPTLDAAVNTRIAAATTHAAPS